MNNFKKSLINVEITKGILFISNNGKERYFKYGIHIQTDDAAFSLTESRVWRRYSEFCWIRKVLKDNYYNDDEIKLPDLPTRGLLRNREDPAFVESRRAGLETFLKMVLDVPIYRSDRALHLFMQTAISINDIEFNLNGQRHDQIMIFKKYEPRYLVVPRKIPSNREDGESEENEDDEVIPEPLTPAKSSLRSSSAHLTNSPMKRVTFCDQVRIISLASAWPADLQGC